MLEAALSIFDGDGNPVTGLTDSNIKFRKYPYSSGDVLTGISISGGSFGVYLADFSSVSYQPAQCWIDNVFQDYWGTKNIGNEINEFLSKNSTTEQDIKSDIDMNSKVLKNLGSGSLTGQSVHWGLIS